MFAPRFIFSTLWLTQVLLHVVFQDAFVPFRTITWVAIGLAVFFFNVGTFVFPQPNQVGALLRNHDKDTTQSIFKLFIYLYPAIALFAGYEIYLQISMLAQDELNGAVIRQLVVADFTSDRILYGYFKVFYVGVGFSIFLLAFSRHLSRGQMLLVLAFGLISAIATTGRLYLLLFFAASIALLYRAKIISPRAVFYAGVIFVVLFFSLAILLSKGDEATSIEGSIYWNAQVYVMSSISCFNDYLTTNVQHMDGGALLPNPAREFFSLIGLNIPPKPVLLPFAEVPVYCNTYTILFPFFHDGGALGVSIGAFLLGVFHQSLYCKYKSSTNPVWWYFYAISLYPLIMSVFEDAYFSSPGFWLLLWFPPLCYWLILRFHYRKVLQPNILH